MKYRIFSIMKSNLATALMTGVFLFLISITAKANTPIELFNTTHSNSNVPLSKITRIVSSYFYANDYRQIKVQVIYNKKNQPNHLLVFLFSKKFHGFKIAKININANYEVISVLQNYKLNQRDFSQQPGIQAQDAQCPDPSTQFIAFAPNDDNLEQRITIGVANAAQSHHLKTVSLLIGDATRSSYLNYMSCPNVIGNFYDGDADDNLIITNDGVISADDIKTILSKKFRYKATNIWLACQAFNDPMKSAVIDDAQAQKYAAGINNLLIGPSDETAACAMKDAMNGNPMTSAFQTCYKKDDNPSDHWGFDGKGSDYFGN